ncbi:MAG TPA: hypothetical protein VNV86_09210 [Candidatus Acidoferrum sp.]|nr:hypothetical protein [Candidatus Acidoferrum sp.]
MAIAIALTMHNLQGDDSFKAESWTKPDAQLRDALNLPAVLIRYFLIRAANRWPNTGVNHTLLYLALVGVVWYLVGIEISGKGQSVLAAKSGMRKMADVLGIGFGAMLGVVISLDHNYVNGPRTYGIVVAILRLIWPVVIVSFYGRDLRASLRRATVTV